MPDPAPTPFDWLAFARKYGPWAVAMLGFLYGTWAFVTGRTDVPPGLPPVFPLVAPTTAP